MTKTNFPWDDSPFVAPPAVYHLRIGERALLFCEARQVLFELNPTADRMWRLLAEGKTPLDVRRRLIELGASAEEARSFVEAAVSSWIKNGHLVPREVLAQLSQRPSGTRALRIHELGVAIQFFGEVPAREVDAVFGQFAADSLSQALMISIVSCHGEMFLFESGRPLGSCRPEELIPQLKANLTDHYSKYARDGFLTHAALLVRNDKTILLSGEPGAGKTTLCVALARSGFEYHGDDIVRIETSGKAVGTPFAACVKASAWGLVETYVPDIAHFQVYRRGDGHDVKYLRMPAQDQRPRGIDFVLLLSRQKEGAAVLEPVEPLQALSALLQSAYSAKAAITAPLLTAFSRAIETAHTFRFVYSSLGEAVHCVEEMIRESEVSSRTPALRAAR